MRITLDGIAGRNRQHVDHAAHRGADDSHLFVGNQDAGGKRALARGISFAHDCGLDAQRLDLGGLQ